MAAGSVGSKASASPSVTAVTMLIHRIWIGVTGKAKPKASAVRMPRASPPFVGRVQATTFLMLS